MRRGRWTWQPECQAWQLDGACWYLKVRTGVMRVFRGCAYCWHLGDDRRWVLHETPPETWQEPRTHVEWRYRWSFHPYGACTHCRRLAEAMAVTEEKFAEHVLKTLSEL